MNVRGDGRLTALAAGAGLIAGHPVTIQVREQGVLAVADPRTATITLSPDALGLRRPELTALIAHEAAHLATPWPVQLRARLVIVAPATATAAGLLALAGVSAVTGRHAVAAYTAYLALVVVLLGGWLPLARHLRRGELGCDRRAAAAVGAAPLADAIRAAHRWRAGHDSSVDRVLDAAVTVLKLSTHPTTAARLAALHAGRCHNAAG